jgi:Protein of unknown function (DUF2510)
MSSSQAGGAAQPGWYADPAGSPALRWWDGASWTEHLSGVAQPQATKAERPALPETTPVYGWKIWLITLLPLLSVLVLLFWNPTFRIEYIGADRVPTLDPLSIYTASYFLLLFLGWAIYAALVVLAYFDWRSLRALGVVRPFHWAWSFLFSGVYVIGRSVIVHKVAGRRGLTPIWVWIGTVVVSIIVGAIKAAMILSMVLSALTTISTNT